MRDRHAADRGTPRTVAVLALAMAVACCAPDPRIEQATAVSVPVDPCTYAADLVAREGWGGVERLSAEVETSESVAVFSRRGGDTTLDRDADGPPGISRIDVDDDGIPDFRIFRRVGTASCERNEFRRGERDGAVGEVLGTLAEDETDCGWTAAFFRHGGKTYIAELEATRARIGRLRAERFAAICSVQIARRPAKPTTVACAGDPCPAFAALVPEMFARPSDMFAGRQLSGGERRQLAPSLPEPASDYEGAFLVDIDNDGVDEIYVRRRGGRGRWLDYDILKRTGAGFEAIIPRRVYADFDLIATASPDFGDGADGLPPDDIAFARLDDKTYVVTVTREKGARPDDPSLAYSLLLIENGRTRKIGAVLVPTERSVTIQRANLPN